MVEKKQAHAPSASLSPGDVPAIGQIEAWPEQQRHGNSVFPALCRSDAGERRAADVISWVEAKKDDLLQQAYQHGAILFRGFGIKDLETFDAFVSAFHLPCFTYEDSLSNAVRINHTDRIFSANEAPPQVDINLHHEMAQTPMYPRRLFFFCKKAARSGGATSLCRSDVLWERLQKEAPGFAKTCQEKGFRYTHTMPGQEDAESGMGRSWRSTFNADTREAAEIRLRELRYESEWLPNDCLRVTSPRLSAIRELKDGRISFFNQLIAAYSGWRDHRNDPGKSLTFGDGSLLDTEGADTAVRIGEELAFDLPWETGDVALIDNFVTMHGRRTFEGQRSVLASFTT